jgi:hypothetical protein
MSGQPLDDEQRRRMQTPLCVADAGTCGQPARLYPTGHYCDAHRPGDGSDPGAKRYCAPVRPRYCYCGQCPPSAWDAAGHVGHLPGRCGDCGWHIEKQGHELHCPTRGGTA